MVGQDWTPIDRRRRYLRFLKRQLSLPVSMMSQWWVRRSSSAVVILASPNTVAQSAKARLVVTMIEVRSYSRLIRWNSSWPPTLGERQIAELVEHEEIDPREPVGDAALTAELGFRLELVDQVDDIEVARLAPPRMQLRAMPMARWLLPEPVPPISTTLRWCSRKRAAGQILHQLGVDRRALEDELLDLLGQRQLGNAHLVADRAGMLLGDLRLEQRAEDALERVLALHACRTISS